MCVSECVRYSSGGDNRYRGRIDYYNRERPHSSLGDLTPGESSAQWRQAA
ncbi:MAG: transposase [Pseudomonadales bacterium]|nr:transposase [Pseudomonadales bacterium]